MLGGGLLVYVDVEAAEVLCCLEKGIGPKFLEHVQLDVSSNASVCAGEPLILLADRRALFMLVQLLM